jgi:Pyruvate/2-oxoacid:ferredoxin oxidoreductase gamma subunit
MVMMGVLAGINELPISLESWRKALRKVLPHHLHEVNEEAFSLGLKVGSEAI